MDVHASEQGGFALAEADFAVAKVRLNGAQLFDDLLEHLGGEITQGCADAPLPPGASAVHGLYFVTFRRLLGNDVSPTGEHHVIEHFRVALEVSLQSVMVAGKSQGDFRRRPIVFGWPLGAAGWSRLVWAVITDFDFGGVA